MLSAVAGTADGVAASSDGLEMLQVGSQDMGRKERWGKINQRQFIAYVELD